MEIILYKNLSDNHTINKNIVQPKTIQGYCKDVIDEYSPDISVSQDIGDYNYMYIPSFKKYYYINGCSVIRTGMYKIENVEEDVLMTLKDQLLTLNVIIDKTEQTSLSNMYIDDGSFINSCKSIMKTYNFPYGFNDTPDFILLTAGAL